jgi:hypothetical protein
MATSMPQPGGPQQPDLQQGQGQGGPSGQANPLQEFLGKIAMAARQLGTQNVIIQPEMQQLSAIAVAALQKVSQAAPGPPQQAQTPGVQ